MIGLESECTQLVLSTDQTGDEFAELLKELVKRGLQIEANHEASGTIVGNAADQNVFLIEQTPGVNKAVESRLVKALKAPIEQATISMDTDVLVGNRHITAAGKSFPSKLAKYM